jgi:hypothetical protein
MFGNETTTGNKAPAKLKHFTPQVKDALLSSGGQHGMSALSGVDISADIVETLAPPDTGAMPIEMAIRAARNERMATIIVELSGDVRLRVNHYTQPCDRGASNRRI